MRYTAKIAQESIEAINLRLADLKHTYYLKMQGRNGYQGLDEYRKDNDRCVRTIATGTPRECVTAANEYFGNAAIEGSK